MNCATGVNDVAAQTDFGALFNSVRALMAKGGEIDMRSGLFVSVTSAIWSTTSTRIASGLTLKGTSNTVSLGGDTVTNGTIILAKTNSMIMLEATASSSSVTCPAIPTSGCTGAPTVDGATIEDITFDLGATSGVTAINFSMAESRDDNRFYDIAVNAPSATGNTTGIVLKGSEDTVVQGFKGGYTTIDIVWTVPIGNVVIRDAAITSANIQAQTVEIVTSTISVIKIIGTTLSLGLLQDYIGNLPPTGGRFNMNSGGIVEALSVQECFVDLTNTIPLFFSTGTISNAEYSANDWIFGAGSNWNLNAATLTKQVTAGSNHVHSGSAPTNFPFVIDGNGNF